MRRENLARKIFVPAKWSAQGLQWSGHQTKTATPAKRRNNHTRILRHPAITVAGYSGSPAIPAEDLRSISKY